MPSATAQVTVPAPGPLRTKLCRHFSHKVEATFDDQSGEVRFPFGTARLTADADTGVLSIHSEAETEALLEQTKSVVGDHLERFSTRHPVTVIWS